ncbi:MAG TPA: nuclease A inhibitor family protein [Gemmatimonadaceae bacterium]|nr:nuclease A inhibitor family protein [Gemmatimonadaceae bacterium]
MSDARPKPPTTPTGDDAATTDAHGRLEGAAAGLVYSSEGDRPFEYVELAPPSALDAGAPITAALVARLAGAARDARIEERTLDAFLARHRDRVDPADVASQALRPRYDALARTLRDTLGGLRVVRVSVPGTAEVRCFVVGRDARGAVVGLVTTAVET